MTYSQMEHNLSLDKRTVETKANSLAAKFLKIHKKEPNGVTEFHEYTSKCNQNNKYLIILRKITETTAFISWMCIYRTGNNKIGALSILPDGDFCVYTPHFLDRYAERHCQNPDLTHIEALKVFMRENLFCFYGETSSTMCKNIDEYQKEGVILKYEVLQDGLAFIEQQDGTNIKIYKTFISSNESFENQEKMAQQCIELHIINNQWIELINSQII